MSHADSDQEIREMAHYITGLVTGTLTDGSLLPQPVTLEPLRAELPGVVRARLPSGMLVSVVVSVAPDMRGGWWHQGHFHPAGDEPHVHRDSQGRRA